MKNAKTRPPSALGAPAVRTVRAATVRPGRGLALRIPSRILGLCVLAALAACATVPRITESPLDETFPLDRGAAAYILVDVPQARPLLNQISIGGLRKGEAALVLDRTRQTVIALFPPDSGRRLQAVAWGNYPSFRARLALTGGKGWNMKRSKAGSFWYSAERDVSLALNRTQAFAALGTAEPGARSAPAAGPYARGPGVPVPPDFGGFREGACLALWIEDPAEPLGRFLEGLRLPIRIPAEEFLAALVPLGSPVPLAGPTDPQASPAEDPPQTGGGPQAGTPYAGPGGAGALYEIRLRIKTPTEANARTLMTLFSTARLFLPQVARTAPEAFELLSLFFARPPEQEGAYLTVRTAPVSEGDIALLFNLFSVYSREN